MVKQSNFVMLRELLSKYQPKHRGIVSVEEAQLITDILCLDEMNLISLQNMRDFVVLFMSSQGDDDFDELDKMSAIVAIIDRKIIHVLNNQQTLPVWPMYADER